MKQVKVTERIYVNKDGERVAANYRGPKTLVAGVGAMISEKRAAELGIKPADADAKPAERAGDKGEGKGDDKSREPAGDKDAGAKGERKGFLGIGKKD